MRIAVIPARGGSRRIPRKNLLPMPDGKGTVLGHAIKVARGAKCEVVYVSTDDDEISKEAAAWGAMPVKRADGLEKNEVGTQEVVRSVLLEHSKSDDTVVVIYPCTPLLLSKSILQACSMFDTTERKLFIVSCGKFHTPIQQALEAYTAEDGRVMLRRCMPQFNDWPSEKFPERFYDAGQFYIGQSSMFVENLDLNRNAMPYFLPASRAIDINEPADWRLACTLYKGFQ